MRKSSINKLWLVGIFLGFFSLQSFAGGYCSRSQRPNPGFPGAQSTVDPRLDSFEVLDYNLNVDLTDFIGKVLVGQADLKIKCASGPISLIELDLLQLTVDSIKINGQSQTWSYNDTSLRINLSQSLASGDSTIVRIWYHGVPFQNPADWGGFYWTSSYAFNIGVSFVEDPHNFGRVWFPCLDNFVDRAHYTFNITTEDSKRAFCGGLLTSEVDNGNGTKTYTWELGQEIPTYLASVAVSDYSSLDWTINGMNGPIPVLLAARANDTANLRASFIHLDSAVHAYEHGYGPYMFDRVGYAVVPFSAGAMEHACNIAYMRMAVNGTTSQEHLMAHELSHHWWGDLVTCRTASDMWLNEGWATYSEFIFDEFIYGFDTYIENIKENHEQMLQFAHFRDQAYLPVSGVTHDNTYSTTVYSKGADMAHSLRSYIGDQAFFSCIPSFMNDYAFQDISSEDLRDYLSTCSGVDLTDFFEDWIFQEGWANFNIDKIRPAPFQGGYAVDVFIRQRLNNAPSLYQNVPVDITFFSESGDSVTKRAMVSGACSQFSTTLSFDPAFAALDYYERLSDATTSEYRTADQTGLIDFATAKFLIDVDSVQDPAFVRIEHQWVTPDPFKTPQPGLHLSTVRYWKVDGIFPEGFGASGEVRYDETSTSGFLDNGLITNTEDSLVLMHRATVEDDWALVPDFNVEVQVNPNNKRGLINWPKVEKGEYVLGIYDAGRIDTSFSANACLSTFIEQIGLFGDLKIFPNPSNGKVRLSFDKSMRVDQVQIYSVSGQKVVEESVKAGETSLKFDLSGNGSGTFIALLRDSEGRTLSKTFIIQQ